MDNCRFFALGVSLVVALALCSCSGERQEVVVYTALDREFSEPILADFEKATGIKVEPKYDIESTKTVGLTNAILAEAARPRCDVFWNNEILNTLRLQEAGLLENYESPAAASYPAMFRDAEGAWHGFAGRARVLIVNENLVPEAERPTSINDLVNPKWKGQVGIAKPIAGTTASHVACLFASMGPEPAKEFLRKLKANEVKIYSGNKQLALGATRGEIAFGLTDTDDAIIEIERGQPVAIVYPDREPNEIGTLFIPNSISIIKGGPNPDAAKTLIDYLLTPEVEAKLAQCPSAQIPLNPQVEIKPRVETPQTVKAMEIDFAQAAAQWDAVAKFMDHEFLAAE
jgi:iron(III) transport system substrate-binding protein